MSVMKVNNNFTVSVRALADFNQTEGDLISSTRPSPSAFEGQHTHQLVQNSRPKDWQTEVTLKAEWLGSDFILKISGRVDCIYQNTVEEIKTSRLPPAEIPDILKQQHHRQARIYAALSALISDHETWNVQVTYVHPQTLQQWPETHNYSREALITEFFGLCTRYDTWLSQLLAHRQQRTAFLRALAFPYPTMRTEQRLMAENVYRACRTGKHLTVEAPTGTGKTLAALFPALKAMPDSSIQSLFFLTMKTTGRDAAHKALSQLDAQHRLSSVFLSAKQRMCLQPESPCDGLVCPYAKNYFGKRTQVWPRLLENTCWNDASLKQLGEEEQVCPYFLSQDWASWADVVVGDINYIYDTTAVQPYLLREIDNRASLLIDEGHNLIDRGRMIFSDTFGGDLLQRLLNQCPRPIQTKLRTIQKKLREACNDKDNQLSTESPSSLCQSMRDFIAQSPSLLRENPNFEPTMLWQDFIFSCARFARLNELASTKDFRWRYQNGKPHERAIELICLNPSTLLNAKHELVHNVIAFSATLKPWHYSNQLNGLQQAITQTLPSPFQPAQYRVFIAQDVSTRYRDRHLLPQLLEPLLESITQNFKNTMVFFSSYQQLQNCTTLVNTNDRIITPTADWSQEEKAAVLTRLTQERGLTLFTVLGGVFAEGIDLPGESLEQVVIVGPGLPQVNDVNNALKAELDARQLPGFEFAYLFPGLQKVLQAVGRCVRTEQDQGDILLIDDRFMEYFQRRWLPEFWQISSGSLSQYIVSQS